MKISKVIEHCDKCQFAKRFNYANANIGCVFVCMKSDRLITYDKEVSHFLTSTPWIYPIGVNWRNILVLKISHFLMKMGMNRIMKTAIIVLALFLLIGLFVINRAQAKYISSLEEHISSRDSTIERIFNDMESIYIKNNEK